MSKLTELSRELLPWYVNNTLSEAEKAKLDLLRTNSQSYDKEVAEELKFVERFKQDDAELEELVQMQSVSLTQLRKKISEDSLVKNQNGNDSDVELRDVRPSNWLHRNSVPTAMAASVAILMVAALSLLYFRPTAETNSGTGFRTLTAPAQYSGTVVQLVFAPTTATQRIQTLLQQPETELLSGPSNNGVYRVGIKDEQQLRYWQQQDEVIWAQLEEN